MENIFNLIPILWLLKHMCKVYTISLSPLHVQVLKQTNRYNKVCTIQLYKTRKVSLVLSLLYRGLPFLQRDKQGNC